ncbi:MAG: hypothetical protein AMJ65_15205 [Phycisphaerae bacterium SG8_4]|nr:MAG: hypothetical protein AMJ65_15205 [Phycisphaerae bacterium SG8_4]
MAKAAPLALTIYTKYTKNLQVSKSNAASSALPKPEGGKLQIRVDHSRASGGSSGDRLVLCR